MELSVTRNDSGIIVAEFISDGRRPPTMTPAVFDSMRALADEATVDPPAGIIFTGPEGGDFQTGVDLEHMADVSSREEAYESSRAIQLLFQRFADLPCPVVAAIEGRCIGGGTELSLACDARIAADTPATTLTLPEILLGIIPGFGGTQRLPRIIGQQHALNMILTGGPIPARQAFEQGLIDRLVEPAGLREEAVRMVLDLGEGQPARLSPLPRRGLTDWMLERTRRGRRLARERYQRVVRRRTGGHHPAPEMAIEAVGLSADRMPLAEGLEREAAMLADLIAGDIHPHLLRLLRCRQAMRRPRGRNQEEGTPVDLTAGLTLPEELKASLRNRMRSVTPDDLPSPALTVPLIPMPGGYGLLRRLPLAVPPVTIEVAWVEFEAPREPRAVNPAKPVSQFTDAGPVGSGSPDLFQDLARRFVVEAGGTPVYCRNPDPSPGLSLITTYLREGERLAAEGWNTEQIDEILEEWGMAKGPHALSLALGDAWGDARGDAWKSSDDTGNSSLSGPGPLTGSGMTANTGKEAEERLIEEVVATLLLTVSREWETVDDPVEESWSILDVFVLGGPSFRGGVIGAARTMGAEKIRERLLEMQKRYGDDYAPHRLNRSGPFSSVPGD